MASGRPRSTDVGAWERQQRRRDRSPFWYCELVTKWRVLSFVIALAANISMILISGILFVSGYDILPISFDDFPVNLIEEPYDARYYAWSSRDNSPNSYDRTSTVLFRTQTSSAASIDLFYDAGADSNIFNKAALIRIREIEEAVANADDLTAFCKLIADGSKCVAFRSVLRYFDGTYASINPVFDDPNFDNIPSVLYEAATNNATKSEFQFFLASSSESSPLLTRSSLTRTTVFIGFPIPGIEGESDQYLNRLQDYSRESLKDILENHRKPDDIFTFTYFSIALWRVDVLDQAWKDVRWVAVSLAFIFLVILFHSRTFFITGISVFSIIASFVIGNLIYNVIFGYQYIGLFHILMLFIILGIGADDIFVFYDIWRQSENEIYISLAHRLSDCYRKSIGSMLFTSLTTVVAFLSSAITPLLVTRSFGVFAAIIVTVNFFSVSLFFPTVVIMYHTYLEKRDILCVYIFKKICKRKHNQESKTTTDSVTNDSGDTDRPYRNTHWDSTTVLPTTKRKGYDNRKFQDDHYDNELRLWTAHKAIYTLQPNHMFGGHRQNGFGPSSPGLTNGVSFTWKKDDRAQKRSITDAVPNGSFYFNGEHVRKTRHTKHDHKLAVSNGHVVTENSSTKRRRHETIVTKSDKSHSFAVRFFRNQYFMFVTHKYIRWIILLCIAGFLGFFIYEASSLVPDAELFNLWPADHNYRIAEDHQKHSFSKGSDDQTLTILYVFGLVANDLSSCKLDRPVCEGEKVEGTFDPNPVDAQRALKDLFERVRNLPASEGNKLRLRRDFDGKYKTSCFIDEMEEYLQADPRLSGGDWSLPFDEAKVREFMARRPDIYNLSSLDSGFDRYLQIPVSYWLTSGYTYQQTMDTLRYGPLIGEEKGQYSSPLVNDPDRLYGNDLKYIAIEIQTTINFRSMGYQDGKPILDEWDNFADRELSQMPAGMRVGFQIDKQRLWKWFIIQEMLVQNAIYGIAIGISLALLIFVIATRNIITGIIATLSVACSTVCVVGVIPLGGWKLGIIEALNMCVIVGLTVDYVLHLAEGYTLSLHRDRLSRVRDMLGEMAVPVAFGAFTSLGAAAFMFLATLRFFFQFGVFMFSTLGFSLLFSLGMFTTIMGIAGPQNNVGDIWVLIKRLYRRARDRKE